jgi:hypothetical protein
MKLYIKEIMIVFCLFFIGYTTYSQQAYWVFFTDKNNTDFNPYAYFDPYAIERRLQNNLSLYDSTDFPLTDIYVEQITALSEEVIGETRWFNALAVFATDTCISKMQRLPFVKAILPIHSQLNLCSYRELIANTSVSDSDTWTEEEFTASQQLVRMEGNRFIDNHIDGKGIRIAVFDGGFPEVNTHTAFEHIRKENRIIKTWNFCNKKENVYGYNYHGRMVLSCIAGIEGNQKLGLATGAEFLLARTELGIERFKEEVWWMMAVEWADKNGAHIINSSLGYTGDRYYPAQMDGKQALVSRAANMAASKGILVVNAAGNEGMKTEWNRMVIAPADADSILSVGGIYSITDLHSDFSSIGPTADRRLKPNVVAWSDVRVADKCGYRSHVTGTSFSSPLVAGFAACAWQTRKNITNMQLKTEIEHAGDLYPYFDYDHGYGVPQAGYFLNETKTVEPDTQLFSIIENDQQIEVILHRRTTKDSLSGKNYDNLNYIYYHIQDEKGFLIKYIVLSLPYSYHWEEETAYAEEDAIEAVIADKDKEAETSPPQGKTWVIAQIDKSDLKAGYVLRVRYHGSVKEYYSK